MGEEVAAPIEARYLCLNCRSTGHLFKDCSFPVTYQQIDWFFSPARRAFQQQPLSQACARCLDLRIPSLLSTPGAERGYWTFKASSEEDRLQNQSQWRYMGKAGDLIFDGDCSMCRALFACIPTPCSDDTGVWIFAVETVTRLGGFFLEGKINFCGLNDEGRKDGYHLCAVPLLWPQLDIENTDGLVGKADGLTMIRQNISGSEAREPNSDVKLGLGGREPAEHWNVDLVLNWIERCNRLHPATCKPLWNAELKDIYLLDIDTRTVVPHPDSRCDFVTLSYVWGIPSQETYPSGTRVPPLPQTIEDAITVTKALGKKYLWIDSICIDQTSGKQKAHQIGLMCSIYSGAWCTLVAVSSSTASEGLARVNPSVPTAQQLSCMSDGVKLVTIGSSLSQTIWSTKWGSRAWTFQEALLSTRCVYFSEQMLLFECNAMTCAESLDETDSHVHNLYWDEKFALESDPESKYGLGILRNPFVGQSRRPERLKEYSNLLVLYTLRDMTNQSDALNAFGGIQEALEEFYPKGFIFGIPVEHFQLGLLWVTRFPMARREGFPSWTWAGWKGMMWGTGYFGWQDGIVPEDEKLQPEMRIEREPSHQSGEWETVYENLKKETSELEGQDPFAQIKLPGKDESLSTQSFDLSEYPGILQITAPTLRFEVGKPDPPESGHFEGESRWAWVALANKWYYISYLYCGQEFESMLAEEVLDWVVLARQKASDADVIFWHLLCVKFEESKDGRESIMARRIANVRVFIAGNEQSAIKDAGLKFRRFLLA